ncbi:hypothetical protein PA598K_02755 [Paenibacillus sp. 598K]|uniref:hypothetical protein n=1 Tax=Paenibacillus sp. 598K TaxID=1117987 RepID=UPI000FF91032|nr:hypothetical protein [Paenibacillus sp. 598K]GBF74412.1 hypothetical protein PA598K_02755 [Paenibacillus sp. 598K]
MKRLKAKYFSMLAFSVLSLVLFGSVASADYFGGTRKDGSRPSAFYHSTVAQYGYTGAYDAGRAYWNAKSQVNITRAVISNPIDRPDTYYIGNTSVPDFWGQIAPINSSGVIAQPNEHWVYVDVIMYDNTMRASGHQQANVRYNAAHEIGHTIKMAHVNIPTNSIMVQGWWPIPASITTYDSNQVDLKWPVFP